jgi:hypothetical protein
MFKQVDESHYRFQSYMHAQRWMSIWHQLNEVISRNPISVLEIGPGKGVFKSAAKSMGVDVKTLDIDPDLNPDYLGSVFDLPFSDGEFQIVCAFQMLEHLPFEKSILAFREMARVAGKSVIISLPDANKKWLITATLPKIGRFTIHIPKWWARRKPATFDGEHYWEINNIGYSPEEVISAFCKSSNMKISKTYVVPENPYHRFFIFDI